MNHTCGIRCGGSAHRGGVKGSQKTWRKSFCRSEFQKETVVLREGAEGDEKPDAVCGCLHWK